MSSGDSNRLLRRKTELLRELVVDDILPETHQFRFGLVGYSAIITARRTSSYYLTSPVEDTTKSQRDTDPLDVSLPVLALRAASGCNRVRIICHDRDVDFRLGRFCRTEIVVDFELLVIGSESMHHAGHPQIVAKDRNRHPGVCPGFLRERECFVEL